MHESTLQTKKMLCKYKALLLLFSGMIIMPLTIKRNPYITKSVGVGFTEIASDLGNCSYS